MHADTGLERQKLPTLSPLFCSERPPHFTLRRRNGESGRHEDEYAIHTLSAHAQRYTKRVAFQCNRQRKKLISSPTYLNGGKTSEPFPTTILSPWRLLDIFCSSWYHSTSGSGFPSETQFSVRPVEFENVASIGGSVIQRGGLRSSIPSSSPLCPIEDAASAEVGGPETKEEREMLKPEGRKDPFDRSPSGARAKAASSSHEGPVNHCRRRRCAC